MEFGNGQHPGIKFMIMKTFLTLGFTLISNILVMAQLGGDFKLPDTWTKEFSLTLSYKSSMSGSSSMIKITFDSVIYTASNRQKGPKLKTYLLKERDREELIRKLHEYTVDNIKSESVMAAVHDGWSNSLCFNNFHCIEGGTSAEMNESDKNKFLDVTRFIEDFAIKHTK